MLEPHGVRERQQARTAQHGRQPARHRRGRVRARGPCVSVPPRPGPPLPHQEVPQVTAGGQRQQPPGAAAATPARACAPLGPGQEAGEEEEGTGDAEERAEAVRADAEQGPQPGGPGGPALGPRAEQQGEDKGGQGAQRDARPGAGGAAPRRQQLHVAKAAEVEEEAARRVLPQGAHAALNVAVPQTLRGRAGPARRLRAPHGFGVSLVPPHGREPGVAAGLSTARTATATRSPSAPLRVRGAPDSAARQGCARRRGPGTPPRRRRSGGLRDILAEDTGGRGFSPGPLQQPLPFSSGNSRGRRLGVAPRLPRAATVTSRPCLVRWARERALLPRGCPGRARAPPAALSRRPRVRARALSRRGSL